MLQFGRNSKSSSPLRGAVALGAEVSILLQKYNLSHPSKLFPTQRHQLVNPSVSDKIFNRRRWSYRISHRHILKLDIRSKQRQVLTSTRVQVFCPAISKLELVI